MERLKAIIQEVTTSADMPTLRDFGVIIRSKEDDEELKKILKRLKNIAGNK